MALFKLQERPTDNIEAIMRKTKEQKDIKPTIKLKGTSLLAKLNAIKQKVKETLGEHINDYQLITTDEEWIEYCKKAKEDEYIAIDTETDSLDSILAHLVGVCIYSKSQKPAYVPVGHISVITEQKIEPQVSIEAIKEGLNIIKDSKLIFHNAYYDLVVIYQNTGIMLNVYWDTLVSGHALNENESHSLKDLYIKYVHQQGEAHYFGELFDGIPACYVPYDIFMSYAAKDAKMTYDLYMFQKPYLTAGTEECAEYKLERVANLYHTELLPMIPVLVQMKLYGMPFDFKKAKELKIKYTKLKEEAEKEFNKALEFYKDDIMEYNKTHKEKPLEYPLNYNSPEQIKVLFYEIAKIGVVYRKEPTGTGKNVINSILHLEKFNNKPIRTIAQCLLNVKTYDKVIGSFIDKLTEDATLHGGKIFSNLNLTGTDTGRLSSSNPNQQNIPSHLKDIRQMFYAGENRVYISCDFSKQEPCILASTSKDPKLVEAFHSGLDIYSQIASMMYNLPYEECLEHYADGTTNKEGKERRSNAKKVTLSLMYSKGVKTLSEDLGYGTTEEGIKKAQSIYDAVLTAYPDMAKWMKETEEKAIKVGYVDNMFGRRRRLPELLYPQYEFEFPIDIEFSDNVESTKKYYTNLYLGKLQQARWREDKEKIINMAKQKGIIIKNNEKIKADKRRNIINFCIQGGAAVITLRAMRNIMNNKRLQELGCELQMSIHDETLCSVPKEHAYECAKLIEQCSKDAGHDLLVPLSCDVEIAEHWYGESLSFDENHNLVKK